MKLIASAYNWEDGDLKYVNSDHASILGWCMNPDSEPMLLRFESFPVICYLELPEKTLNGKKIVWSESKARQVYDYLSYILRGENHQPFSYQFIKRKKLYYYRADKTYPFLFLMFNTQEALRHCQNLIRKPRNIQDLGTLQLILREERISMTRKMLTNRNCRYSQWFEVEVTAVTDADRISTLTHEYLVDFRTLRPLPPEESKEYMTYPRVFSFDIETYSDQHNIFPVASNLKHESFQISCIYQRTGHPDTRKNYLIILGDCRDIPGSEVIRVQTELELIEEFVKLIDQLDPEIITGYNIFGFDYPYLHTRLSLKKKQVWKGLRSRGSRLLTKEITMKDSAWASSGRGHNDNHILQIPGRISIDLLPIIKKDYKLPKYDLNTVGNYFLGKSKHDVPVKDMFCAYEDMQLVRALRSYLQEHKVDEKVSDQIQEIVDMAMDHMTKVAEYCIQDAYLVLELMEKLNIWIALVELSNIVGVTIMDIFTRGQQIGILSQLYNLTSAKGYVIDSRQMPRMDYDGGYVSDPTPGLHDNVICLDFNSLYPNLMRAFNICHTTLVPPESDIEDSKCNIIEWTDSKQTYRYRWIKSEYRQGILPQLLGNLLIERKATKKLLKVEKVPLQQIILDKRQSGLKVNANSIYGVLGVQSEGGLISLIEGAMCTTASGRQYIQMASKYIEDKYGGRIIYGDTDSTMFQLPFVKSGKEAVEWGHRLEKEISATLPPPMYLEYEKAGRVLSLRKKMYAFWMYDDEGQFLDLVNNPKRALLAKGITLARRDNCEWERDTYREVLYKILERKTMVDTLIVILDQYRKLYEGHVNWKDLAIIKGIGKSYDPESTYMMKTFADEMTKRGTPVRPGERIEYVIVKSNEEDKGAKIGTKMRPVESYDYSEPIDVLYYIEKALKNKLETLWSIGYNNILDSLEKHYVLYDASNILNIVAENPRYREDILNIFAECSNEPIKTLEVLKKTRHKNRLGQAKTSWNRNLSVRYRIDKTIIKTLVKAIKADQWSECLAQLELQAAEMEKQLRRPNSQVSTKAQ